MSNKISVVDGDTIIVSDILYASDDEYMYAINENEVRVLGRLGETIEVED